MKILFVYPNVLMVNRIPLGIAYLSAILKKAGHEISLFDTTFFKESEHTDDEYRHKTLQVKPADLSEYGVTWEEGNIEEEFEKVLGDKPDQVWYTLTENMYPVAIRLIRKAKELGFYNVVGGVLATVAADELRKVPEIDLVWEGEGEEACLDILNGGVTEYPLYDIENLPFQNWSLFSEKHIYRPIGGKVYRTGNFMISRGCPYGCGFCINESQWKKHPYGYHREMSVKRALDEIEWFKKAHALELINFHDETFLLMSSERLAEFCAEYKRRIGLPFSIVTRVETIEHRRMRQIVDAGCINMSMSIECGNETIRRQMLKRNMSNEVIIQAFKTAKEYPLRVSTSNMIGIPGEGRRQIFETILLNRACKPDSATVNMLYPYRGTSIREHCLEMGYLKPDTIGAGVRSASILDLPTISKDELLGIQRCFQLYMRFPLGGFSEIQLAERSDLAFNGLVERYREEYPDAG